jgi:ribosomal protein S27E
VISGKDLCLVIENKTNTSDHYMQLADYRDWVQKQKATYKALLYLTYEGYKASDKYIADKEYECISYTKTICPGVPESCGNCCNFGTLFASGSCRVPVPRCNAYLCADRGGLSNVGKLYTRVSDPGCGYNAPEFRFSGIEQR